MTVDSRKTGYGKHRLHNCNNRVIGMRINYYLAVLAAVVLCASCVRESVNEESVRPSGNETYSDADDVVKGWVRIKLDKDAAPLNVGTFTRGEAETGNAELDAIAAQFGATEVRRVFNEGGKYAERRRKFGLHLWYDIKIDENATVTRAVETIKDVPGVAHVQPIRMVNFIGSEPIPADVIYRPSSASIAPAAEEAMPFNDPRLPEQWNYHNDGTLTNNRGEVVAKAGADINLFEGWKAIGTYGDPDVVVAVLDMGIQWDHPDLKDNMWRNEAEINGTADFDDDNNGYKDDFYGANFISDNHPHNSETVGAILPGDHGTHVAGTIAAVNNNGEGVCGIAGGSGEGDGVKLMTCQIMTELGGKGIVMLDVFAYAADNGANIANCSFTISQTEIDQDTSDALDYFIAMAGMDETGEIQVGPMAGGLIVCGAGNSGTDMVFYPAKDDRTVAVGAITATGAVGWYSEYGPEIDIMAPGGDNRGSDAEYVLSTIIDGYGYEAGTSMATPHVSGVAALILSKYKGMGFTAAELRKKLEASCRPMDEAGLIVDGVNYNGMVGNGVIDVALTTLDIPEEGPQTPDFKAEPASASVRIYGPVPVDGNGMAVVKYNFEWAEVIDGQAGEMQKMVISNTFSAGDEYEYIFEGKSDASYTFRMNAVDRYGNESDYIEFDCDTNPYTNRAPVLLREFSDVSFNRAGEDNYQNIILADYFEEQDAVYGDYITYSVKSTNDRIARGEIVGDRAFSLRIFPISKGECILTVTATDTNGASVSADVNVTVKAGSGNGPSVVVPFANLSLSAGGSKTYQLSSYFRDPTVGDVLVYEALSSDEDIATVNVEGTDMTVTGVAEGVAVVTVTAIDNNGEGESVSSELQITVTGGGATTGTSMSVTPNPVDDQMTIAIADAGAVSANIVVYDAAARKVMEKNVSLGSDGSVVVNGLDGMTPGIYSVVVTVGDSMYNSTFVKR